MRTWQPTFTLDPSQTRPLSVQIAHEIARDIRRGRLRRGAALPGSRPLAEVLSVHRNTVLAAYRELVAEGWITTKPAGGTFVSESIPDVSPRGFASRPELSIEPRSLGFALPLRKARPPSPEFPPGTMVMASGVPDPRLFAVDLLASAYRRVLRMSGGALLGYGDPRGHPRLREALAEMLSAVRGLSVTADSVVVTRGSQMAIDLVARAIVAPGDVIAVEALGYPPAWAALEQAGAKLRPIPVDKHGLSIVALEKAMACESIRAIYVTPHHQYPTTVTLSAGRRIALLELARRYRIAIIEDDYDYEFHYEGRPVVPLACGDRAGVVVYIGTLSKILAPGLRIGFLVAPQPLLDRVTALRTLVDRQGDQAVECAVAELLEDGEVQRHARRMKRIYKSRRDVLAQELEDHLTGALKFDIPAGGMGLWATAVDGTDVEAWGRRTLELGVGVLTTGRFAFGDGRPAAMRLGFASLNERELKDAVRKIAAARAPTRRKPRGRA